LDIGRLFAGLAAVALGVAMGASFGSGKTLLRAEQVAALHPEVEADAMAWIEALSEFDADGAR
jgi:hypothetical protein